MITKFNAFSMDLLLESAINESMLYFSPKFREFLGDIDSPIARALQDTEGKNVKNDVTFIDMDGPEGYITFNTMANAMKNVMPKYRSDLGSMDKTFAKIVDRVWEIDSESEPGGTIGLYGAKSRNSIKIGRFVNRLFPSVYKDKDVEDFVNKYKAGLENLGERFEIVEGADIAKWYHRDMYKKETGHLGSSCMNHAPASYFEIYSENPEQCRMLILIEDGKLVGRALIWKIEHIQSLRHNQTTPKFEYFLDRQYTFSDSDVIKFKNYAEKEGWAYKRERTHSAPTGVMFGGESYELKMTITLDDGDFGEYPYMDTFKYLEGETICNEQLGAGARVLSHTDGTWRESGKWSNYYDDYIDEDDATWSEWLDDWIVSSESITIGLGSSEGDRMPDDHDQVRYDYIREEYLMEDDTMFSDYYDEYIFDEDARDGVVSMKSDFTFTGAVVSSEDNDMIVLDQDEPWYNFLVSQNSNWENYTHIHKTLMVTEGGYGLDIPMELSISVFSTIDDMDLDLTFHHLSEIDAYLLDIKIDKNNSTIVDIIWYNNKLEEEDLLDKIIAKTKEFGNQLSIPFDRRLTTTKQTEDIEAKVKERAKTILYSGD